MLTEAEFPAYLKEIDRPPGQIFWQGLAPNDWLALPRVAVVGSRKASLYGQRVTGRLCQELAGAGVVIISGLAYGIDAIAHRSALKAGGLTVAVLGSSLDRLYPVAHQALGREIVASGGCLLSEYGPGQPTLAHQFIARNRLVSALAEVVVVAEAAAGSGSLHTAQFGLEQGRTVMAIPGPIDQPSYVGCNRLINSGALAVTSAEDILLALGLNPNKPLSVRRRFQTPAEARLYELLQKQSLDQQQLADLANLEPAELSRSLTNLELAGHIRPLGAGHWTIK